MKSLSNKARQDTKFKWKGSPFTSEAMLSSLLYIRRKAKGKGRYRQAGGFDGGRKGKGGLSI